MGEEEKKPEGAEDQKKMEEKKNPEGEEGEKNKKEEKKEEGDANKMNPQEESKDSKQDSPAPPSQPPPPQEIVLKVYMHCEGCARKVRRCLKGFEGVENVTTDCRTGKVVVKGEKADPSKVLARVQRKSHRHVELLSPLPPPPPPSEPEKKAEEEKPKPEDKKEEPPVVLTVVLKVNMHCEACAMEIKKRIQRMKGVESADPDLKGSQVTVKGLFEPSKLVEYVYKRTGKHSVILKIDPPPPPPPAETGAPPSEEEKKKEAGGAGAKDGAEESKGNDDKGEKEKPNEEKKDAKGDGGGDSGGAGEDAKLADKSGSDGSGEVVEEGRIVEVKKIENPFYYYGYPSHMAVEMYPYNPSQIYAYPPQIYAYPPQMFSDENPNACALM